MQAVYCSLAARLWMNKSRWDLLLKQFCYILNKALSLYLTKANGVKEMFAGIICCEG